MKYKIKYKGLDAKTYQVNVSIRFKHLNTSREDDMLNELDEANIYHERLKNDFPYPDADMLLQTHIKYLYYDFRTTDSPETIQKNINTWLDTNKNKLFNTSKVEIASVKIVPVEVTRAAYVEAEMYFVNPFTSSSDVDVEYVKNNFPYPVKSIKIRDNIKIRVIAESNDSIRDTQRIVQEWVAGNKPRILLNKNNSINFTSVSTEDASRVRRNAYGETAYSYYYNKDVWEDNYDRLKELLTNFVKKHYTFLSNAYDTMILPNQGHPAIMVEYKDKHIRHTIWLTWSMDNPNQIYAYKTKDINTFTPFSSEELKFLDGLDLELFPAFTKETGQDITDWFGEV